MNIVMLSTDKNIFASSSDVRMRMQEYGKLFNSLHVIVFSKQNNNYQNIKLANNVFVYPTNSKSKLLYFIDVFKIFKKILKKERKIDFISAQDPYETGLIAFFIAGFFKVKLHIQVHTDVFSTRFKKESFKNRIRVKIAKFILKKAHLVRVVSSHIEKSIRKKIKVPHLKIFVLPVYIDIEKFKSLKRDLSLKKKYKASILVLSVARLEKEKNLKLAIDAFSLFKKSVPEAKYLLVGDGNMKKELQGYVKNKGLENDIIFTEWSNEVAFFYKSADIFLLTSNYEGFGRTIVEALAAGVPVVSVDVGVAKDVGAIIADCNPKDIAEKMIYCIKNNIKGELVNYPYSDKEEYLRLFKKQFEI